MRAKRLLFAVVSVALFFGAAEGVLWLAGVRPLLAERDPFRGFSGSIRVFEPAADGRTMRTVDRAVRHSFRAQRFLASKPARGLRLFVLGGSSAYGFPWGAETAFPAVLERGLEETAVAAGAVEVVNAAAMSYGSHRLRILAGELLRHDPDLLVVYGGHNEFVERSFYRDMLDRREGLDPLRALAARWRLYALLTRAWEALAPPSAAGAPPDGEDGTDSGATAGDLLGLDVVREYELGVGDTERREVLQRFEANLQAILDAAAREDVPVVLCTVPSNLGGWPPNQSLFAEGTAAATRHLVERLLDDGRRALEQDPARAAELLERATRAAPEYAVAWFWLGRARARLERTAGALDSFRRARDLDAKPSRAPGMLNDAIRRLAAAHPGAILADVERAFEALSPAGPGFDLFEDYVHPKPEGHAIIAAELWRAIAANAERLRLGGAGDRDRDRDRDDAPQVARFWQAIGQPGGPRLAADPEAPAADAGATTPAMLFNLAVVLEHQGLERQAMDKYRACLRLDPHYVSAQTNLARLLLASGQVAEAEAHYREAAARRPDHLAAWLGLGETLRRGGTPAEALTAYRAALERAPDSARAWDGLGGALSQLGRQGAAEEAYRRVVELDPDNPAARASLGFTLLFQGELAEAEAAFREGLRLRADHARSMSGLAAVLTDRGEWDEAERLFRESLSLAPQDEFARGGLEVLERRRAGGDAPG